MLMIISISCGLLYIWWCAASTGFERVICLGIFVVFVLPLSINYLLNSIKVKSNSNSKTSSKNYAKNTTSNTSFKSEFNPTIPSQSFTTSSKGKTNPSEYYPVLRENLVKASKERRMSRESILIFLSEVDYRLKEHKFVYDKFSFQNEMHSIYTKIKSSKLQDQDYIYLIDVLNKLTGGNL